MGHVVVTGAGRGLGLELTRQLARRGDTVFATVRNPEGAAGLRSVSGLVALADALTPSHTGRFFQWDGSEHPW